jgi:mannose-1-phosphate guanylyltransferase
MSTSDHAYAVILAGGGGTRLWPKSRNKTPKQFLKLFGNETLMQLAVNRITKVIPWERIIVVTNKLYIGEVKKQLPQVSEHNIIAEPQKKDTAIAMLVGAMLAKQLDPDAVVINIASDHIVENEAEFLRVVKASLSVAAEKEFLVSVGITPSFPSTGFGYIKIGDDLKKLAKGLSLFKVESFTEKPNQATARAFISTGRYFWNANMYVWSVDTLIDTFNKHMPDMINLAFGLADKKPEQFNESLVPIYEEVQAISIDYAISEKAENLTLIPGDFGWNDVGDWRIVYDLKTKNLSGNVVLGDREQVRALAIESNNNLIHTDGRLVALVGIDDMVIVDTPEILMIVPKARSQEVKKLVDRLKEEAKSEYL